ncbi:hypothetical protein DYQ86_12025 [Acidobacteria bacterium AB60]|nr:hypothetical protein DYQ86_12025 [Acidobacteria bacterium AB60]
MDAHVVHIGQDHCHRAEVLRNAGYRVEECATLPQLAGWERAGTPEAIFLTESEGLSAQEAVSAARARWAAPLILFQSTMQEANGMGFDLVIPPLTSPRKWLRQVRAVVEWSRGARAQVRATPEQGQFLRRETERKRDTLLKGGAVPLPKAGRGYTARDGWNSQRGGD